MLTGQCEQSVADFASAANSTNQAKQAKELAFQNSLQRREMADLAIENAKLLEKLPFHKDFELHGTALLHYFYSWRPRLSLSPSSSSYYKLRAALSGRPTHMVSR